MGPGNHSGGTSRQQLFPGQAKGDAQTQEYNFYPNLSKAPHIPLYSPHPSKLRDLLLPHR